MQLADRVGRVLSFFSSRRNCDSPTPHQQASVPPNPPPRFWGKGHTRWWERGWESPSSGEGTYTVVLFKYTYFVHLANSKSADAGITFLKAFGIYVNNGTQAGSKMLRGARQIAEC